MNEQNYHKRTKSSNARCLRKTTTMKAQSMIQEGGGGAASVQQSSQERVAAQLVESAGRVGLSEAGRQREAMVCDGNFFGDWRKKSRSDGRSLPGHSRPGTTVQAVLEQAMVGMVEGGEEESEREGGGGEWGAARAK